MSTTLYVKTHDITGMKYFGKTTKKNPEKYLGSGKRWKAHLRKHGNQISTEIIGIFDDIDECREFAIKFSSDNNIVASDTWANLIEENGLDGAPEGHLGHPMSEDGLQRISKTSKERWSDPEYRQLTIAKQRASWTPERRAAQTARLKGQKRPDHSATMKTKVLPDTFFHSGPKSEEHKKKISEALKGKPKTAAAKENMRRAALNRRPQARISD